MFLRKSGVSQFSDRIRREKNQLGRGKMPQRATVQVEQRPPNLSGAFFKEIVDEQ